MNRGCASDLSDNKEKCHLLGKKCGLCHANHLDGCNNEPITKNPTLSCVDCEGAYNESCAWGHHQEKDSKQCQKEILFPGKESCYTLVNRLDQTVKRGCTLDRGENVCDGGNNSTQYCQKCFNDGCNNQNVIKQSCLVCHSGFVGEENCADKFPSLDDFSTVCEKPVYGYDERGCYVMKKSIMLYNIKYLA